MLVARQRSANSFIFHHNERNAIRERPIFVVSLAHALHAAIEKFGSERNNFHARTGAHSRDQRQKIGVIFRSGTGVSQFQQNKFRCDGQAGNFGFNQRAFVIRLGFIQQSQIEKSVGENGVHDFSGSPLT